MIVTIFFTIVIINIIINSCHRHLQPAGEYFRATRVADLVATLVEDTLRDAFPEHTMTQ